MENKQRIISINNEGKTFFIYFTGKSLSENGKVYEMCYYLDENLDRFINDISLIKEDGSRDTLYEERLKELESNGMFIGPHMPEVKNEHGEFVPNNNPNTMGLWRKSTKEEKDRYIRILIDQNNERTRSKLVR